MRHEFAEGATRARQNGEFAEGATRARQNGREGSSPDATAAVAAMPAAAANLSAPGYVSRRHRLTAAFEALEALPALAESRDCVLRVLGEERAPMGDVVAAVESDPALVLMVLRVANRVPSARRGRVANVPAAVDVLSPAGVRALATRMTIFESFDRAPGGDVAPERFRLHAVAVQRAAARLAQVTGHPGRDELLVSALLHDVGKLVLRHAYAGYPERVHGDARTPEDRLERERRELGFDHGTVGGVLARRWGLPARVVSPIERHHAEDADGEAALIRLADMLAHHWQDGDVDPRRIAAAGRAVGITPKALRAIVYELPHLEASRRDLEPCPLSVREVDVLRELASGKVYKQIAAELGLATSTIRTHLHNTYAKLGAPDRAQAVLEATRRGWI